MKLHPLIDGYHPSDPAVHPLIELLIERDMPVLIHCGPPIFTLPWSIEEHHIDIIPDDERHGRVWHQFTLWFGGNTNVFNVVLGGVAVSFGLSFYWALIAIAVGTCIGALLIALHFLFLAVFLLNFGFIAAQFVIQAQSMNLVAKLSIPGWILILAVPAVVIGSYGYRWVHRAAQVTAVLVGITIVVMFIQALSYGSLPGPEKSLAAPPLGLFVAGVALLVIDMLSYGPFVSDYSRYLPRDVKSGRVFLSIYLGNIIATIAACAVGAHLAALLPKLGSVAAIGKISGSWALVIMGISLINADTFNAYTGPFVKDLGGADISWLVGFVVSAVLYIVLAWVWPVTVRERAAAVGGALGTAR